jgi:hypothetical protein
VQKNSNKSRKGVGHEHEKIYQIRDPDPTLQVIPDPALEATLKFEQLEKITVNVCNMVTEQSMKFSYSATNCLNFTDFSNKKSQGLAPVKIRIHATGINQCCGAGSVPVSD